MKREALIVSALSVTLAALVVATVFASRVPPKPMPSFEKTIPVRAEKPSSPAAITAP